MFEACENQKEHEDYCFGNIVSAIYNQNRDTKKYGMLKWWHFMARWADKHKAAEQQSRDEDLKSFLIAKAKASGGKVIIGGKQIIEENAVTKDGG